MKLGIGPVASGISILAVLVAITTYFVRHDDFARAQADEQVQLKAIVQELSAIHRKTADAEEAQQVLLDKLCRQHKLKPEDCPELWTPAVPPPAPTRSGP